MLRNSDAAVASASAGQRVPDPVKPDPLKVPCVGRRHFCDPVLLKRQGQTGIEYPAPGKGPLSRQFPDSLHHRCTLDETPEGIGAIGLANLNCLSALQGPRQDGGIAQEDVEFHKDELANYHVPPPPRRTHEVDGRAMLGAVRVLSVEEDVRVYRYHRSSVPVSLARSRQSLAGAWKAPSFLGLGGVH